MNDIDFEKLVEPITKVYQDMEYDLICKIASYFQVKENVDLKNSMKWYANKVSELGGLTQEAIDIISKQSKIPKSRIIKILQKAGIATINLEDVSKANQTGKYAIDVDKLINSRNFNDIINHSYKDTTNFLKLINTKSIEGTKQAYMDVLNQAYTEVRSGLAYNTSIRKALTKMSKQGITVVSYKQKNGTIRNYGIESCVRRDVLTAVVQTTNNASTEFMKQAGYDYCYVSQHLGARVTNTSDYKDHAWWQGKVYKITGSESNYPNFQDTCKEGDVQGFGGANCRHIKFGFIPGISVLPKKLSAEENEKIYSLNQKQRAYERKIKALKRQCGSAKASNDKDKLKEYQKSLVETDNEYKNFIENNNLKRHFDREQVVSNSSTIYNSYEKEGKIGNHVHVDENLKYTDEELYALNQYFSTYYSTVLNEKLRNKEKLSGDEQIIVTNLDNALRKTPNYHGLIVRALDMTNPEKFISELKVQENYTTNQYLSFSNKEGYNEFANVKIYVQNSKQGRDLRKMNSLGENEVLYERNKSFKTLNISERNGIIYVLWEER